VSHIGGEQYCGAHLPRAANGEARGEPELADLALQCIRSVSVTFDIEFGLAIYAVEPHRAGAIVKTSGVPREGVVEVLDGGTQRERASVPRGANVETDATTAIEASSIGRRVTLYDREGHIEIA
jgi:hypothetical protein